MDLNTIRAAKNGNEESIKRVMNKYSNLINKVKRKYHAKGYDQEDFESVAMFGVWRGIEEFNETKLKFIYNRKTKTWRVCEKELENKLSASISNQVKRYIARIWRGEQKQVRKGTEVELKAGSAILENKTDQRFETTIILNDIVSNFNPFQTEIAKHLLEKRTRTEISNLMKCSKTVLRKEINLMAERLSSQGYFLSSHTY